MMERTLKTAHDKGIILIAAAGNAGPKSPPLYPGADPSVIAVTATDYADKPFAMANRGKYIAVAAPGVDVMVPAPNGSYQLTTGTSVAAAHVSGIAALADREQAHHHAGRAACHPDADRQVDRAPEGRSDRRRPGRPGRRAAGLGAGESGGDESVGRDDHPLTDEWRVASR